MASSKLIDMFPISYISYDREMHCKVLCNRTGAKWVLVIHISVIFTGAVQVVEQATQAGFLTINQSLTD